MASIPPLPTASRRALSRRTTFALIAIAGLVASLIALAIGLRIAGLLIPYRLSAGSMNPTIRKGDCVLMEGWTYRSDVPKRGDLVVFRTRGIAGLAELGDEVWLKRLVALPGEAVLIKEGQVRVNGKPVVFTTPSGEPIRYHNMGTFAQPTAEFRVPADSYFVLGDNSGNSLDSRYWGALPKANVMGKVWFRYWPMR